MKDWDLNSTKDGGANGDCWQVFIDRQEMSADVPSAKPALSKSEAEPAMETGPAKDNILNLPEWLIAIFTIVLAITAIVQAVVTYRQLEEMKSAGRQTDKLIESYGKQALSTETIATNSGSQLDTIRREVKDSENSQAANLVIRHNHKDPNFIEFEIHNLGGTAANQVNFHDDQIELPLRKTGWFGAPVVDVVHVFRHISSSRSGYSLGPRDSRTIDVGLMTSQRFLKGDTAMAIYAQAAYKDVFGREHHTSDCVTYIKPHDKEAAVIPIEYLGPCTTPEAKTVAK